MLLPIFLDTRSPPPTANIVATPNSIIVNGITIFTAANAESPTPCPTKIPSIIVYNDETNIAKAEGTAYFKNSFIIILPPFLFL